MNISSNVRHHKWSWTGHINRIDGPLVSPLRDRICQENTSRKTSTAVDGRPGQKLEGYDLEEDSSIQANLEKAC